MKIGLCGHPLKQGRFYCSRSCAMKATRAKQSPERRSQIGREARATQRDMEWERFKARLMVFVDSEDKRLDLAVRYGRRSKYVRNYRNRKAGVRA